jgi:hypothetical protein
MLIYFIFISLIINEIRVLLCFRGLALVFLFLPMVFTHLLPIFAGLDFFFKNVGLTLFP